MTLFKMENRRNFGFSAENPTGTKGGGTRAKDCEKLSPCIQIQPGETVTLCDGKGTDYACAVRGFGPDTVRGTLVYSANLLGKQ